MCHFSNPVYIASDFVSLDCSGSVWVDISESSGEDGKGGWIPFANLVKGPKGMMHQGLCLLPLIFLLFYFQK